MFLENNNPYDFQFIITGIKGDGIKTVFLPDQPDESEILFKKEQKFIRTVMSREMRGWVREWDSNVEKDPDFIHSHAKEIIAFEDQESDRITYGIFFWNNGKIEYMTPFHYWYCNYWQPYFGYPSFRVTDMEFCYFMQYCEEDSNSYGTLLNTIRRYGKSSIMGAWSVYGPITNAKWTSGLQGESDRKIVKFFRRFVTKPFFKLPSYIQPKYDTSTEQKNEILLDKPAKRGSKRIYNEDDDDGYLESMINFMSSEEGAYDGEILHRYAGEEVGKTLAADVYKRWAVVKPCLKKGNQIRGKALLATTVENMETSGKGGIAYKKLFLESDVDERGEDNRTISGLYMCFIPGDCALEDSLDEWGYPDRDANRESILAERRSLKGNPSKYSMHIRQYPLTIKQIFYVSADHCEFNVTILQDRQHDIEKIGGIAQRGDFVEIDGRDSRIVWKGNEGNGRCLVTWLPDKDEETNLIKHIGEHPEDRKIKLFEPLNNQRFKIGHDPIMHGIDKLTGRSLPVLYVKRSYDASIDGELTNELMEQRAKDKFEYQTNVYTVQFDHRFLDPNKTFEYVLSICRFHGCSLHVEKQKAAIINYFYQRGYGAFIMSKFQNQADIAKSGYDTVSEGTAASQPLIQQYTSLLASYTEYFGHTIPFLELIEDMLMFRPLQTKEHDYTVAAGFTELASLIKTNVTPDVLELTDIFRTFDNSSNVSQEIS